MRRVTRITKLRVGAATVATGLVLAGALFAETPGRTLTVHINGANYGALPTGLKVGDSLTWVNDDTVAHTVTARNHAFDLHINPGQSATQILQKDGSFQIYCLYHSTMRGVLVAGVR